MTAYLVTDANGNAVSSGTVIADPLPVGLAAYALSDTEWADMQAGAIAWDATTRALVPVTPAPDPRATLLAEVQAATTVAKLRAAVLAAIEQGAL